MGSTDTSAPDNAHGAPFIVVGAGLSGTLMALFLARRGYPVELLERRPDPRRHDVERGRSINMAISERGLNALRAVGLEAAIKDLCIPMYGRCLHAIDGAQSQQPYGQPGQHINSISRRDLNVRLLQATEEYPHIRTHFDVTIEEVDLGQKRVALRSPAHKRKTWLQGRLIIGADGTNSIVRDTMTRHARVNYAQDYLDYGYKELLMPPLPDGSHALPPHCLHIWPRHKHMLIALPNQDGSFTGTLFLPWTGNEEAFSTLTDVPAVEAFFQAYFPDALAAIPDLAKQFFDNPVGAMVSIRCSPWHRDDSAVLVGDAAHAIVPFYGQGMNAAFEDCFELDQLFDAMDPSDLGALIAEFSARRFPHAEAIRKLALDNFVEMRSDVASPAFLLKKQLERTIQAIVPNRFVPLYSMISFTNIPYADAVERAKSQDEKLVRLVGLVAGGAVMAGAALSKAGGKGKPPA